MNGLVTTATVRMPELARDLRDHRRRTRARAAAHAGGDEQHVAALDQLDDAIAVFHRRLAADFRVRARAESLRDVAADLQRGFTCECLSACASVFTQMNSTPSMPLFVMWATALPPPPPTPITLMTAVLAECIHQFEHGCLLL